MFTKRLLRKTRVSPSRLTMLTTEYFKECRKSSFSIVVYLILEHHQLLVWYYDASSHQSNFWDNCQKIIEEKTIIVYKLNEFIRIIVYKRKREKFDDSNLFTHRNTISNSLFINRLVFIAIVDDSQCCIFRSHLLLRVLHVSWRNYIEMSNSANNIELRKYKSFFTVWYEMMLDSGAKTVFYQRIMFSWKKTMFKIISIDNRQIIVVSKLKLFSENFYRVEKTVRMQGKLLLDDCICVCFICLLQTSPTRFVFRFICW